MSQCSNINNSNQQKRRCLYDILEVARSADYDQIKVAYKKQARIWHPDKNINNADEATIRFKEINEAYEILSDKHERAWYDAHRDAILRGFDKHEINKMKEENDDYDPDMNLMPYFSPFIFNSFDDNDENSYYNIYNQLFLDIIDLEKLSKKKTPIFGNSKLPYHKMKEFYDFWEQFESRRSFQWTTKYNLNDATNRKMRKLMHKENRKLIDTKRKKWEETILKLVAFIKKRDPRFRNYLIDLDKQRIEEEKKLQEYQREIDEIMKEEQRKQREIEMEQHKQLLMEKDEQYGIEEEEFNQEIFECVICNKTFKSQNAFNTHQSSKKHLKAVEQLKFQLQMEQELIFDDNGNPENDETKINDQNKLDAMIAKQIAHQENVDNDNGDDEETDQPENDSNDVDHNDNDENENDTVPMKEDKPIDIDYLIALSMEQQDIIEAVDLFADDNNNQDDIEKNRTNPLITDSEIMALLESGIDIESLVNTYPSLTKQYIIDLIRKTKSRKNKAAKHDRSDRKWKKNKRKKRNKKYDEIFVYDDDNEVDNDKSTKSEVNPPNDNDTNAATKDHNDNEEEEELDKFMKQFQTFNKKSDFIHRQRQRKKNNQGNHDGTTGTESNSPKKKRRRRRKSKDTQNQRNMSMTSSPSSTVTVPIKSKCKACNETFQSKTKLYAHLKEYPQHALRSNH